ncbi:hypothetical protein LC55x_3072 [Lysobacter capsici]|nr:hypothetical protein LC55x_3072 [Lysobacter capsici]
MIREATANPPAHSHKRHQTDTQAPAPFFKVGSLTRALTVAIEALDVACAVGFRARVEIHELTNPQGRFPPLKKGGQGGFAFALACASNSESPGALTNAASNRDAGRQPPFAKWAH